MNTLLETIARFAFHLPTRLLSQAGLFPPAVARTVDILRARLLLRNCRHGPRVAASGDVRVKNRGEMHLGARVTLRGGIVPTELRCGPGATLNVGDETTLNYGVAVWATRSIHIGQRCLLGSFVRLQDQREGQHAPIYIGDDVWIAHGATIGPGVTIGDGSVVAAGCEVTRDVPPGRLAIGSPMRCASLILLGGPSTPAISGRPKLVLASESRATPPS